MITVPAPRGNFEGLTAAAEQGSLGRGISGYGAVGAEPDAEVCGGGTPCLLLKAGADPPDLPTGL